MAISRISTKHTTLPQMMSRGLSSHDQKLSEEEFTAYYFKKMVHFYTKNEVQHWRSGPGLV